VTSWDDHTKICAATQDGQLVVWNGDGVGEVLFELDGFDFTSVPASICITSQLLISNGLEQYVCVDDKENEDHLLAGKIRGKLKIRYGGGEGKGGNKTDDESSPLSGFGNGS
jgi:hypothetical protein